MKLTRLYIFCLRLNCFFDLFLGIWLIILYSDWRSTSIACMRSRQATKWVSRAFVREPGTWKSSYAGAALRVDGNFNALNDNPDYSASQPNFNSNKVHYHLLIIIRTVFSCEWFMDAACTLSRKLRQLDEIAFSMSIVIPWFCHKKHQSFDSFLVNAAQGGRLRTQKSISCHLSSPPSHRYPPGMSHCHGAGTWTYSTVS